MSEGVRFVGFGMSCPGYVIERNVYATKNGKELKKEQGHLISPRPKQKFGSVHDMLDAEVLQKFAKMRIVFLIDEIHRSHSGDQHKEMVSIFDELQLPFDNNVQYQSNYHYSQLKYKIL